MTSTDPVLSPGLVERVLLKLGLANRPVPDLDGLNTLYTAWCGGVPFDNVRKRIWFAGDQTVPLPGGDPAEFFEYWLAHGTGATCWPTSGGMYALLHSLGFDARRIAGAMIESASYDPAGHGSVLVTLEGVDYLVDASILAFEVVPLVPGEPATAGVGIHAVNAQPIQNGFDVLWYAGWSRDAPIRFRTVGEYDPVDHSFFLESYEQSKESSSFNDVLHICRRYRKSITTIRSYKKTTVAADGTVNVSEIVEGDRTSVLVDELGISEEMAEALPPDMHVPRGDEERR
jgi:arylamine N-acetyltransferase